jgi:DNA-directed RNA polymerase specialized sigma24 family protein
MLPSPKMPALTQVPLTHVDLYVEFYDRLRQWATRFAENDHEMAEDLLHDTFIQFTLSKPDLSSIQNLDGYLYTVMRNLHLSQIRRSGRNALRRLTSWNTTRLTYRIGRAIREIGSGCVMS